MTKVSFGGAIAVYIDGKLQIYRGSFDYDDIMQFLFRHIQVDFEPLETIFISEESTFWDTNHIGKPNWMPAYNLEDIKAQLDMTVDVLETAS